MNIEIYGKNYIPSESLKKVTAKKCEKLQRRFKNDADATLKFNVTLENDRYTTDVTLQSHSLVYRASATSDSPFDNLDEVMPKLVAQVSKQKDIWDSLKKSDANDDKDEDDD